MPSNPPPAWQHPITSQFKEAQTWERVPGDLCLDIKIGKSG